MSFFESTPPKLQRQISSNVSKQNNPTCWAFTVARVILKFIKNDLPELQTATTDITKCDKYYDFDKFTSSQTNKNRFFLKQTQIPKFFKRISSRRCGRKEYKNLCLFMFIYYQLTNKFGCETCDIYLAFEWFVLTFINQTPIFEKQDIMPDPYNSVAERIIMLYHTSGKKKPVFANSVYYDKNMTIYPSKDMIIHSSIANNVVAAVDIDYNANFNYIIKNTIDNNLYLSVSIDVYGDKTSSFISYKKNSPRVKYGSCLYPPDTDNETIGLHGMTIVDYIDDDPNELYVVIKNSWGLEWGDNGTITISMSELKTHCFLQICYVSYTSLVPIIQEMKIQREQKDRGEVEISLNNIIRNITDIKADGIKKKNTRKRRRSTK
jgi:hypothetical protein